jgi:hypothetical protein
MSRRTWLLCRSSFGFAVSLARSVIPARRPKDPPLNGRERLGIHYNKATQLLLESARSTPIRADQTRSTQSVLTYCREETDRRWRDGLEGLSGRGQGAVFIYGKGSDITRKHVAAKEKPLIGRQAKSSRHLAITFCHLPNNRQTLAVEIAYDDQIQAN